MVNEKEAGGVDLDVVNTLVAALQCDVKKLRGDSPDIQRLKDELQTLRNVLDSPLWRPHWVRDGLHAFAIRWPRRSTRWWSMASRADSVWRKSAASLICKLSGVDYLS